MTIFMYARISRKTQNLDRQVQNLYKAYPEGRLYKEAYTGTKIEGRKIFRKMIDDVLATPGDKRIVFDSVSRMSRDADNGISLYMELFDKGVQLEFLKEPYINTEVYASNLKDKIELLGTDEDELFRGINNYFRKLATKQIRLAFEQAEKEVTDLQQRTREGIREARRRGKQIGSAKGSSYKIKKEEPAKNMIRKHCKEFGGSLTDKEVIQISGICQNTFYKYKREIREEYI